ncbi:MAG: GNAT family N-acetyltransferase [Lachnospiraceae bacterium]|nr:GNAT family N-acetyltransferase [Lachnospiraceae bacterium]
MSGTFLREVEKDDLELLYSWVNEESVRKYAFDSHIITLEEHTAWFNRMMSDPNQIQFIMMVQESPVGQIRFSVDGSEAEIDYSISQHYRGCGYGREIIRIGIKKMNQVRPNVKKLIGRVKATNSASIKCFMSNKFNENQITLEYDMSNEG